MYLAAHYKFSPTAFVRFEVAMLDGMGKAVLCYKFPQLCLHAHEILDQINVRRWMSI